MLDIEKLRALEKTATPKPWAQGIIETDCIASEGGHGNVVLRRTNGGGMPTQSDLDLICEMRNALPAILAELEALRAIAEELASKKPEFADQRICVFCGMNTTHKEDCLINRAREAIK